MKFLTISLLLGAIAVQAGAQEVPKNACQRPTVPNAQSSDVVIKFFHKHMTEYQKCIDKFVEEQRALSEQSKDPVMAKRAFDAAEQAQNEYNDLVNELNAQKPTEE